jgi:hypothetical protein
MHFLRPTKQMDTHRVLLKGTQCAYGVGGFAIFRPGSGGAAAAASLVQRQRLRVHARSLDLRVEAVEFPHDLDARRADALVHLI